MELIVAVDLPLEARENASPGTLPPVDVRLEDAAKAGAGARSESEEARFLALAAKALEANPDNPETLNNLAWMQATSPQANVRDGIQAVADDVRKDKIDRLGRLDHAHVLAAFNC